MRLTQQEILFFLSCVCMLLFWNRHELSVRNLGFFDAGEPKEIGLGFSDILDEDDDDLTTSYGGGGAFFSLEDANEFQGGPISSVIDVKSGIPSDYLSLLNQFEQEISFWANTNSRDVYFWGTRYFFLLYNKIYSRAFEQIGFSVRRRMLPAGEKTAQTGEELGRIHAAAMLCLSHSNPGCYTTQRAHFGIKRYQKVNRLLALRDTLWDKGSFCKTLSEGTLGDVAFTNYTFPCWIVPEELKGVQSYLRLHPKQKKMICKPLNEGAGKGIKVIEGKSAVRALGAYKTPHLVQTYLENPHLIKGRKWDMRAFVLISSTLPVRAYLFHRGIVRFAAKAYDLNAKNGGDKAQFLTNTHISKKYAGDKVDVSTLTCSYDELKEYGVDVERLLYEMRVAVAVVFLSGELKWKEVFQRTNENCDNCYQILGVDIIVDSNELPRVIEVNGQPNLLVTENKNDHYSTTKWEMVRDTIAMVHNENSAPTDLVAALSGIEPTLLQALGKTEWIYLIEYWNEKKTIGGFLPAYPFGEQNRVIDHFFQLDHATPLTRSRKALHRVLQYLFSRSH